MNAFQYREWSHSFSECQTAQTNSERQLYFICPQKSTYKIGKAWTHTHYLGHCKTENSLPQLQPTFSSGDGTLRKVISYIFDNVLYSLISAAILSMNSIALWQWKYLIRSCWSLFNTPTTNTTNQKLNVSDLIHVNTFLIEDKRMNIFEIILEFV